MAFVFLSCFLKFSSFFLKILIYLPLNCFVVGVCIYSYILLVSILLSGLLYSHLVFLGFCFTLDSRGFNLSKFAFFSPNHFYTLIYCLISCLLMHTIMIFFLHCHLHLGLYTHLSLPLYSIPHPAIQVIHHTSFSPRSILCCSFKCSLKDILDLLFSVNTWLICNCCRHSYRLTLALRN